MKVFKFRLDLTHIGSVETRSINSSKEISGEELRMDAYMRQMKSEFEDAYGQNNIKNE